MKSTGVRGILVVFACLGVAYASSDDTPKREERKAKSVTSFVSAKWETTPIVLELAEYLAGESVDLFWSFVDGINSLKTSLDDLETDKQVYDACIGVASTVLAPPQLRMAKLALSMRTMSPTVRMFDQIATQNNAKEVKCDAFVAIASKKICDNNDLKDLLKVWGQLDVNTRSDMKNLHVLGTYLLDHSFPSSDNRSLSAILYGELGSKDFATKHKILSEYADKGVINYVVRWNVKPRGRPKVRLSGYGVELQLKSTEYKSQDDSTPKEAEGGESQTLSEEEDENDPQNQIDGFNFGRLKNLFPALRTPLERFRRHLSESSEELAPLKVWQMQALSMQAAAAVVDAHDAGGDEALKVLTSIAQNFPMQTKSLIHVNVPRAFRDEVLYNQDIWSASLGLRPAEPLLLVSGAQYDADEVDVMALLAALREDIGPMNTLHALGLSKKLINTMLSLELGESYTWEEYGLDIRDTAISWLNDLEADERYRRWPTTYMELLRPTYPGMLRNLKRNIYNYVIVADPTSRLSGAPLRLGETLLKHATPVRVGLVLAPGNGDQKLEAAVRSAFNYVAQERNSNKEAFYFLTNLLHPAQDQGPLTIELVQKQLHKYVNSKDDIGEIVEPDSEYNFGRHLAAEFVTKLGNNKYPQVLINGVPLTDDGPTPVTSSVEVLEEALVTALSRHTGRLQRAVFRGELIDENDAVDYIMKQPHVMPRLNRRVLGTEPSQFLDLSGVPASVELFTQEKVHKLLHLSGRDALVTALPILRYFTKNGGKPEKISQTIWIAGDLNDVESRQLLKNALTFMKESGGVRVAFIPNVNGGSGEDQSLNKVVVAALHMLESHRATEYVAGLLENEGCHDRQDCDILPELIPALHKFEWVLGAARVLCARGLRLRPDARAVVHNARLVGPLHNGELFTVDDFLLLERFSNQVYGDKLSEVLDAKKQKYKAINEVIEDDDEDEESIIELSTDDRLKVISVLAARSPRTRTLLPSGLHAEHSLVELPPLFENEAAVEIVAVLDPASIAAQRLAPLLLVLRRVVNCHVKLFVNPQDKNSDMPLKSFYRYVLEPELQFTSSGALSGGAMARFSRLPHAPLLSMELRTPTNWLVECVKSVYDLDNIRLADVDTVVHSEFELEYLLLEGHAWDAALGTPPRGLQLILGSRDNPDLMDTIVMANLGYFQLKANPGAWILRLRPGRSDEIYEIVGHENTDTPAGSEDIQVLMSSFRTHVIKLRVSKKPDKQNLDLLVEKDDKNSGGIWNSIASSFGGGVEETDAEDETINVFSVASGHLYERFLRIMMLSVLKNTKSPVKFWFLTNYLSPSLKDSLPYMAQEYGFQYELVQYQWPRWLQRQRDRQRTIWGYKILFLDVLFPLHVKKIIFVDADQIVRADLKELVDFDLGGAPYGYTPFCESRKEMEGFRFWKQGYWRNHLQGRSYHISALYVVDLRRFRRIAAGDRLRGQYQALSQDPNSLSNLDQDLPNNMIHQVAIKSLPQEWLWCETWCDDNSKASAKTIDLCNNPMTKEAKLSAAMRIVPEWTKYDKEIKALQARVRRGLYEDGDQDQEVETDPEKEKKESDTVVKKEKRRTEL